MKVNKDKRIGSILFIVEGERTEFEILKRIFCQVLNYEYVEKRRTQPDKFINKGNKNNRIYVINTRESNIKFISDNEYLENVFELLINNYELNIDDTAIFYLFDRDRESNTNPEMILEYIKSLKNPYENDDEKGGLLLLSYPSIESFVVSSFMENTHEITMKLGKDVKTFIGTKDNVRCMQYNKFNEETLKSACKELENYILKNEFLFDIDEISSFSEDVFKTEEDYYSLNEKYHLISQLVIAFLYLGILEPEEGDCFYLESNY